MQNQQFGEKAHKLLERLSSISFKDRNVDFTSTCDQSLKSPNFALSHSSMRSPESCTILELAKLEQQMSDDKQDNYQKIRSLNEEVRKLETYIKQETESRVKMNECFVNNVVRVEKNLQSALANVRKLYAERERRLEQKISAIIKNQHKLLTEQLEEHDRIHDDLNSLLQNAKKLGEQLVQVRKNRTEIEDRIFQQFNDQIKELKNIFQKSVKQREEREMKILEKLKNVYKRHSESIREEEREREANEKMFLTVIEQLINRITEA